MFQEDVLYFWAFGRLFITGQNPYDQTLLISTISSTGNTPALINAGNAYLPWSLWLFSPLGYFSLGTARWIWFAILFVAFFSTIKNFTRIAQSYSKLAATTVVMGIFIFFPLLEALFRWGQTSILLLWALSGFMLATLQSRPRLRTICCLGLLLKPHLVFFLIIDQVWRSIAVRNYRMPFVIFFVPILASYFTELYSPGIHNQYLTFFGSYQNDLRNFRMASLSHLLSLWTGVEALRWSLYALFGIVWFMNHRSTKSDSGPYETSLLILYSVAATPYAWGYDFALLLPAYLLLRSVLPGPRLLRDAIWITAPTLLLVMLGSFGIEFRFLFVWILLFVFLTFCSLTRSPSRCSR